MNGQDEKLKNKLVCELVEQLHDSGKLRVWSIIVTVFGDAIMPRGGVVSLSSLQNILGLLDVESNAVRTAMSRLASDGWVKRQKIGRQSFCSLTRSGQGLFETASERIYAHSLNDWDETFEVVLRNEDSHKTRSAFKREMRQHGFGSPISDLYLRPARESGPFQDTDKVLATMRANNLVSGSIQEFVSLSWPMDDLNQAYTDLKNKFEPIFDSVEAGTGFSPAESLVVRTLLVHDWRKLVLQDVDLPVCYKPKGWVGEDARVMVAKIYQSLVKSSEQYLDDCLAGPSDTLPKPISEFSNRFSIEKA